MAENHLQLNPDGTTSTRKTVLWPSSKALQDGVLRSLFNQNSWTVNFIENQNGSYWKLIVKSPTETLKINLYISSIRDESRKPDEFKMQLGSSYPTSEIPDWITLVLGIYVISDDEGQTCQYILAGYDLSAYDFSGNPSIRGTRTKGLQKAYMLGLYATDKCTLFRPDFLYYYIKNQKKLTSTQLYNNLAPMDMPLQQIFYGAPGTGKSNTIKEMCAKYENYRTTFHPDTDYSSFVGSYKPITQQVPVHGIQGTLLRDEKGNPIYEDRIVYRYVFQAFLQAYIAAWREQQNEHPNPVFLIVEEINRGNCAQIFGDIFQLLDRNDWGFSDYPIIADKDLEQELLCEFAELEVRDAEAINSQYLGDEDVVAEVKQGKKLLLPSNLYIWATMNTSDQSLFPIDSAFKRRWDWNYIKIKDAGKNYKIKFSNGHTYDWWKFVEAINEKIEGGEIQQEDKKLGYFFAKARNGEISAKTFLSKVIFYLYNDVFKDFGLEEDFFKDEAGQTMTFASYFDHDGSIDESRVERFITNLKIQPDSESASDEGNDSSFPGLYVGDKKIKLITDVVIAILTEAAKQHTFAEIEQAVARIPRKADPVVKTIDNPDNYEGENRWNKTVVYDRDGQPFVVSNQWNKEQVPAIKEVATGFGIETRDAE